MAHNILTASPEEVSAKICSSFTHMLIVIGVAGIASWPGSITPCLATSSSSAWKTAPKCNCNHLSTVKTPRGDVGPLRRNDRSQRPTSSGVGIQGCTPECKHHLVHRFAVLTARDKHEVGN